MTPIQALPEAVRTTGLLLASSLAQSKDKADGPVWLCSLGLGEHRGSPEEPQCALALGGSAPVPAAKFHSKCEQLFWERLSHQKSEWLHGGLALMHPSKHVACLVIEHFPFGPSPCPN